LPLLWNHFLGVRNKYYAEHKDDKKKGLSAFDAMKMLTALNEMVERNQFAGPPALPYRMDRAFKSFFKRNKAYPRFKSKKDTIS